jgi:hypothetical protein
VKPEVKPPPLAPALDLVIDFPSVPVLVRTSQDKAVKIGQGKLGRKPMNILDFPLVPHNLWMIAFGDVTIWNKTSQRVSLQFQYHTAMSDPVDEMELAANGVKGDYASLLKQKRIPITLEEHGPNRNASKVPGVLTGGLEKWVLLEGPLSVEPLNHAKGALVFFYQQYDETDARLDYSNGEVVVIDRLTDATLTCVVKDGVRLRVRD